MPKSNTVNRMPREREGRGGKTADAQRGERWGETGIRDPESSRQKALTKERRREHQRRIEQGVDFSFAASAHCEQHSSCCYLHSS